MPLEGITVYDMKSFTQHQHDATLCYKRERDAIVNKLIAVLFKLGQGHLYHSINAAPSAISMSKYNCLKVGQTGTNVVISEHAIGPGTTVMLNNIANNGGTGGAAGGSRRTVAEQLERNRMFSRIAEQAAQSTSGTAEAAGTRLSAGSFNQEMKAEDVDVEDNHKSDYEYTDALNCSLSATLKKEVSDVSDVVQQLQVRTVYFKLINSYIDSSLKWIF